MALIVCYGMLWPCRNLCFHMPLSLRPMSAPTCSGRFDPGLGPGDRQRLAPRRKRDSHGRSHCAGEGGDHWQLSGVGKCPFFPLVMTYIAVENHNF